MPCSALLHCFFDALVEVGADFFLEREAREREDAGLEKAEGDHFAGGAVVDTSSGEVEHGLGVDRADVRALGDHRIGATGAAFGSGFEVCLTRE